MCAHWHNDLLQLTGTCAVTTPKLTMFTPTPPQANTLPSTSTAAECSELGQLGITQVSQFWLAHSPGQQAPACWQMDKLLQVRFVSWLPQAAHIDCICWSPKSRCYQGHLVPLHGCMAPARAQQLARCVVVNLEVFGSPLYCLMSATEGKNRFTCDALNKPVWRQLTCVACT